MRLKILLLLFGISNISFSQQSLERHQIHRLADAGKIYGHIKYFHPYLQYKNINWDSAFVASVPNILKASNKNEYEDALQEWLSVLNDPLTTVIKSSTSDKTTSNEITYNISDSVLFIDLSNYKAFRKDFFDIDRSHANELSAALSDAKELKGVVIDLRPGNGIGITTDEDIKQLLIDAGLAKLFTGSFYSPSSRRITYRTAFYKHYQIERVYHYRGSATRDVPLVFIVNQSSVLPGLVVGLQQNGKAAIIQTGNPHDVTGADYRFYISDSVLIRMRKSELINEKGSIGCSPNLLFNSDQDVSVYDIAQKLIIHGYTSPLEGPTASMYLKPTGDYYAVEYSKQGLYPTLGYRVLAAAQMYVVIDNFFAYKQLMDGNWEDAYRKCLPDFVHAKDSVEYIKAVATFNHFTNDGHSSIVGSPLYQRIVNGGNYPSPIYGHIVQEQFIVNVIANDSAARALGIKRGDVIMEINGRKPVALIEEARKYMSASTLVSQSYFISRNLLKGEEGGTIHLKIKDAHGIVKNIHLPTSKRFEIKETHPNINDRLNSPVFGFITKDIGYADLTKLKNHQVDSMFELFRRTKAIIFDMRGYPNETAWTIAPRLTDRKQVVAAMFKTPLSMGPIVNILNGYDMTEAETWVVEKQTLPDTDKWTYKGKTVMLINESAISQSEHTGLFLKAANNTIFIGSETAGTNGTAFGYPIPGGIWLGYTAHQTCYPDGTQLQRIGLKPDIYVRPTIKGIQAGKDEVLQRAVKYLQTGK